MRNHIRSFRTFIFSALLATSIVTAFLAFRTVTVRAENPPFIFTAAGDWNSTSVTDATLDGIAQSGSLFTLATGDMSYSTVAGSEPAWCDYIKAHVGAAYPFELIVGNHESDPLTDGVSIDNFAACLPDRMNAVMSPFGRYAWEYYIDQPNLRAIAIAADNADSADPYSYLAGTDHYNWLRDTIREAKTLNKWVVVSMHKNCITMGVKSCEIGTDLMNLIVTEGVDLVLQGHDHTYQRTKQLTCIATNTYNTACTRDFENRAGVYEKGAGTTIVIVGTGGAGLYDINVADTEAGYFAAYAGNNIDPTHGFVKVTVTDSGLGVDYIPTSGTFADHFDIVTPLNPPTPTPIPTVLSAMLLADSTIKEASPSQNFGGRVNVQVDASPVEEFLIKFEVSGINARTVTDARLRLFVLNGSTGSGGSFYRTADTSWLESGIGGVTWNTAPPADSVPIGILPSVTLNTWAEVNVTPLITGDGVYSFRVKSTTTDGVDYASKQGITPADKPQLIVSVADPTPTPTPTVDLTPTPTDIPVPTPTPTEGPTPTPTPVPEPPTPTPTPTPLPPTPTPTPTPVVTELVIPISDDASVFLDTPTKKYGSNVKLLTDSAPVKNFLMKFNITGTSGRTVTQAKLRLYNNDGGVVGGNFYTTSPSWSESTVTWNTAPAIGTFIRSLGAVAGTSANPLPYDVDVTPAVTGDGPVSFRVTSPSSNATGYISKQGTQGKTPVLIISLQ